MSKSIQAKGGGDSQNMCEGDNHNPMKYGSKKLGKRRRRHHEKRVVKLQLMYLPSMCCRRFQRSSSAPFTDIPSMELTLLNHNWGLEKLGLGSCKEEERS